MLQAEEVRRDEYGFWSHSAVRASTEENLRKTPGAEGVAFHYVEFFEDAPEEEVGAESADGAEKGKGSGVNAQLMTILRAV